jgi:5-methylcytosine-specific restriction endonuclease McrA
MKPRPKKSIFWKIDKSELENIVKNSQTIGSILNHFGFPNKGGNSKTLQNRLRHDNIDFSHIPLGRGSNKNRPSRRKKTPIKNLLCKNSNYSGYKLKIRLLKENMIKNECAICGLTKIWNNKPISLQIDHINGDSKDHRLNNLRLLCPNCHSQTDTFAGKNKIFYSN